MITAIIILGVLTLIIALGLLIASALDSILGVLRAIGMDTQVLTRRNPVKPRAYGVSDS